MFVLKVLLDHPHTPINVADYVYHEKFYSGIKTVKISRGEYWQAEIDSGDAIVYKDNRQAEKTEKKGKGFPVTRLNLHREDGNETIILFNTVAYLCNEKGDTIEKIMGS